MKNNGYHKRTTSLRREDAQTYLEAALSISQLLKLYAVYAETHGFDSAILTNGLQALKCEIQQALRLIENGQLATVARSTRKIKKKTSPRS